MRAGDDQASAGVAAGSGQDPVQGVTGNQCCLTRGAMSLKAELTWLSMKASKTLPVPAYHVNGELRHYQSVPWLSDEHAEGCAGVGLS